MKGRVQSPCKDCKERREACHAICERYKAFEKQNAEERAKEHKNRFLKDYTAALVYYPTKASFAYSPEHKRPRVYKTHKK